MFTMGVLGQVYLLTLSPRTGYNLMNELIKSPLKREESCNQLSHFELKIIIIKAKMKFPIRIAKLCSISLLIILLIASLGVPTFSEIISFLQWDKQALGIDVRRRWKTSQKNIFVELSWHHLQIWIELLDGCKESFGNAKNSTQKTYQSWVITTIFISYELFKIMRKTFLGFGIFCLFLLLLVIGIDFSYFCLGKKLDSLVMNNASAILGIQEHNITSLIFLDFHSFLYSKNIPRGHDFFHCSGKHLG